MKELLLPLVAASILCSLAVSLSPEGRCRGAVKLVAALVMAAALLCPLSSLTGQQDFLHPEQFQRQASLSREKGESAAENLRRSIIERELETYIVQQAKELGISLTVKLTLDEEGLPEHITLTGSWTQEEKTRLEELIRRDLGIPPDHQIYLDGEGDLP